MKKTEQAGFTIIEVLVAMIVIGVLAGLTYLYIASAKDRTYFSRTKTELISIANAAKLHANSENYYPIDISFGVPPEYDKYIAPKDSNNNWPNGPWPGSYYDYESWDVDKDGKAETYQISLRFCTKAENLATGGSELCKERAPGETFDWAKSFDSRNNSIYYCIKGYCRANCGALNNPCTLPASVPGYCINCPGNTYIKYPGES